MRPLLFEVGGVRLPSYGLAVVLGGALAVLAARRLALVSRLSPAFVTELSLIALSAGVLGAKLGLLLFGLIGASAGAVSQAGFFDVGLVAAVLAVWLYSMHRGESALAAADVLSPAAALGEGVARLGCLAAGCCHGVASESGLLTLVYTDPAAARWAGTPLGVPLHATPIYMSAGAFVIAVVLMLRATGDRSLGKQFGGYLLGHGLLRFSVGWLRWDALGDVVFGLGMTQLAGLGSVAIGLFFLLRRA